MKWSLVELDAITIMLLIAVNLLSQYLIDIAFNGFDLPYYVLQCPSNPSSPKTTIASPQTAITEQPVGGINTQKVTNISGSQQEGVQTVVQGM